MTTIGNPLLVLLFAENERSRADPDPQIRTPGFESAGFASTTVSLYARSWGVRSPQKPAIVSGVEGPAVDGPAASLPLIALIILDAALCHIAKLVTRRAALLASIGGALGLNRLYPRPERMVGCARDRPDAALLIGVKDCSRPPFFRSVVLSGQIIQALFIALMPDDRFGRAVQCRRRTSQPEGAAVGRLER
jgi:hypothetical protein